MNEEIEQHVAYLNGLCGEMESLKFVDAKDDLFQARRAWDNEFYFENSNYREEKFVDKSGKEWYLLLEHCCD